MAEVEAGEVRGEATPPAEGQGGRQVTEKEDRRRGKEGETGRETGGDQAEGREGMERNRVWKTPSMLWNHGSLAGKA